MNQTIPYNHVTRIYSIFGDFRGAPLPSLASIPGHVAAMIVASARLPKTGSIRIHEGGGEASCFSEVMKKNFLLRVEKMLSWMEMAKSRYTTATVSHSRNESRPHMFHQSISLSRDRVRKSIACATRTRPITTAIEIVLHTTQVMPMWYLTT